jgi:DNA invertase Pin-like site-specific DNA recombinase
VRQSTPQQVAEHTESTARQYGLTDRAVALGWPADQVEVIDEDQGRSGATIEGRPGFQRLLAEISLDQIGLVLGLEMSRLARSCKDWHQLVELCGLFRTLLADADGVYDPTDPNDRMLLGLRGMMSEAELHVLQSRMHEGKLNKARRGELFGTPPIGYVKLLTGELALDPDDQVREVVRMIFDEFDRQGSLHGLLCYLTRHEVRVPIRPPGGPNRGQLEWRRPNRETLQNLLHNPTYAGTYRWGHRHTDPRRKLPGRAGTGRRADPAHEPIVIEGHLPAYITAERYRSNQERLAANQIRAGTPGPPRNGPSLLGGVLFCGRCGRRMRVCYGRTRGQLRYTCSQGTTSYAEPTCQSVTGRPLDEAIAALVLEALAPAGLEISLRAASDLQAERDRLTGQWEQKLERARYQSQRAERQYQACEPENRLVARELERRWDVALAETRRAETEFDRFRRSQPAVMTADERAEVFALAVDLPAVWAAATTTPAERQRVIRCLVERVTATVDKGTERVEVVVRWSGGCETGHDVRRPVGSYEQLSDLPVLLGRIEALRGEGLSLATVAGRLNAEGFSPPKRTGIFTGPMLARLQASRRGRPAPRPPSPAGEHLETEEYWLTDLVHRLGVPVATARGWVRRGWVNARVVPTPSGRRWAVWADTEELARLDELRNCPRSWDRRPRRAALIVPKPRAGAVS